MSEELEPTKLPKIEPVTPVETNTNEVSAEKTAKPRSRAKKAAPVEAAEPAVESASETPSEPALDTPVEPAAESIVEPVAAEVTEVVAEVVPETPSNTSVSEPVEDVASEPEKSDDLLVVPIKPKRSLFGRLFGWLKPKSRSSETTETTDVQEAEHQVLTDAELAMSPTKLRREIAQAKRELKASEDEINLLETSVTANSEAILTIDEEVEKLGNWQDTISRTFVAKTQWRMQQELATAKTDMETHEAAVKNLKVLEPGVVLKLRKAFHKSLSWALVICGGLIITASLIKFRDQLPKLDWLSLLYDPNVSGPILIGLVTLLVGGVALITRKAGKQKLNLSRILWSAVGLSAIAYLIWDSSQKNGFMKTYVNPFVDRHYYEILVWVGSVWLIWVASALIGYYRNWSIFQRDVDEQINGLQAVIDGYVKTQQEILRLGILHRQTNDWLKILANALFRPWRVNPDWGTSKEFSKHYETFPFALRVAQALEGNDSRMAELERIIGGHLLTQGWRAKAFEDLVKAVGEDMGLPDGKFTVDFLDQDLPHQTNNARGLLSKYLTFSATNTEVTEPTEPIEPQTQKLTNGYLVKVAKTRLLTLIEKTQSHAIATARPRVEQIIDDPLIALRSDESGLDEFDASESWDDFLTDAMGAKTIDQFPLGPLTFTPAGRQEGFAAKVQTFVVVPKRLANALPAIHSESIQIVPLGDDKPRSVEIIARIDVVGPIEFKYLQVLSSANAPREPKIAPTKVEREEEKL
jgi:hypothetical protein